MTEVPRSPRRRDRGHAPRSMGPTLAPLPRLTVPWAPLEILTPEQVERIVGAWIMPLPASGGVAYLLVKLAQVAGWIQ